MCGIITGCSIINFILSAFKCGAFFVVSIYNLKFVSRLLAIFFTFKLVYAWILITVIIHAPYFLDMIVRLFHHLCNPSHIIRQSGVYTEFTALAATFAETSDTKNCPRVIGFPWISAEQRSSAVTRARIHFATAITRTEHIVRNSVIYVDLSAGFWGHYWNLKSNFSVCIVFLL